MLNMLVKWLTPIFEGMGVSPTDVQTYVEMLGGYIYAIVGLFVLAVAVMVAAHWIVKKGTRHVVRWGAGVSWVLIVTVIANVICFGPMYNNLAPILNTRASVSEESIAKSLETIEEVGAEGMALVKNENNALPLTKDSNLNVFGWAATNPIYGGTGSGSSDSASAVDILTSLSDAGFKVNQDIIDMYTAYKPSRESAGATNVSYTDWSLPEPPVENYTDELMDGAKEFSDRAMIVISRSGGEGQDSPMDMKAVIDGTYDVREEIADGNEMYTYFGCSYTNNSEEYDDFDEGESYLELSNTEEAMVEKVCSEFEDVVVVINANNAMELGWVNEYEQIGAVILAPGTGASGMAALGDILNGTVNPSGRTVDTYVYDLTQTPYYNNIGNFTYNNVADLQAVLTEKDPAYQGVVSFVNYAEGI